MFRSMCTRNWILVAVVAAAPLLTGAEGGCGDDVSLGGDEGCEVDGVLREPGESFPSADGCNTCTCQEDGGIACTEMACDPGDGCIDEAGEMHAVGEGFPSPDGCNSCYCEADGTIACTAMACDPDDGCDYGGQHYAVGEGFPSTDGCNNCFCDQDGLVGCTEMACACDPELICTQVLTCVDGLLYPSGCGPSNCDEAIGPCESSCDPTLECGQALSCVDGSLYPTTCGPANCDDPLGPCDEPPPCEDPSDPDCPVGCDPTLLCTDAPSCFEGQLYPTGCGPANCDEPIGPC